MSVERLKAEMTVSKALSLITNKYSCEMVERHVRALNRISNNLKSGVPLKELPELCQLLRVCAEKLAWCPEYEEPLCRIVALCSLPFLKERSSDENTYAPCVIETLSLLGTLMKIESDPLRQQVAQAVADFYTAEPNEAQDEVIAGLLATRVTYNAALVERSGVARFLAEAQQLTKDQHTKLTILKALQALSSSGTNCNHILAVKACDAICSTLFLPDPTQECILACIEVLWNLLEHGSQIQIAGQLNSLQCIRALHHTMAGLVISGAHVNSKQLRNDLLTLCSLTASLCPDAPFVETGFLQDICSYFHAFEVTSSFQPTTSSHQEFLVSREARPGERGRGREKTRIKRDEDDFEFAKTLIVFLTTLSRDQAAVKVMCQQKMMRCLLSFVLRNDHAPTTWSSAHFEELQLLVLSCLCTLAPLCVEDYMVCQGSTRLLLVLEWCSKTDDGQFRGYGNAFHGRGGHGTRLAQLRQCTRVLLAMCRIRDEVVLQDLHDQGAIPLLIGMLKHLMQLSGAEKLPSREKGGEERGGVEKGGGGGEKGGGGGEKGGGGGEKGGGGGEKGGGGGESGDPDPGLLQELQSDILLTVSCLCETDIHRKELFGGYDGVNLLIRYLQRADLSSLPGGGHQRLLLVVATDCVWCTVVGNPVVEDIFLEQGGAFSLLDLLQVCPLNNQSLVLGVLVDLCENPKAIPHVVAWRGREKDVSSWGLLASLWRQEETDMGVPREDMGTLAGTDRNPLVGAEQEACGVPPIPSHRPSAAVIDITENMRAKIYILCCKMGFQYMSDDLTAEDKITLCIIRNYLDFKSGEVWYEVAGELSQEGLRPVTPDQEALQEVLHSHEEKAEHTLRLQSELMEEQSRSDREEEQQYYEKIQQLHYMEEKARADFDTFVNRTSNHKALQEAKRRQLAAIDTSRRSNVAIGDRFHSIGQSSLNVTAHSGRYISVATTPIRLLTAGVGDTPTTTSTLPPSPAHNVTTTPHPITISQQ